MQGRTGFFFANLTSEQLQSVIENNPNTITPIAEESEPAVALL